MGMLRSLYAIALLAPALALAQQPASLPPQAQACQQRLLQEIGASLDASAQLIEARAQIADLTRQLADAKKETPKP